jgi:hypothetical protein
MGRRRAFSRFCLLVGSSYGCKTARFRFVYPTGVDAVPNVRVRPVSTAGERTRTTDVKGVRNVYVFETYVATPGGRKPPLMAEVGQSLLRGHNTGMVRFMQANDLRGLHGRTSGREPAMLLSHDSLDNAAVPVRWA